MKKLGETKHVQVLMLKGKNGESIHADKCAKTRISLAQYKVLFWDGEPEHKAITASQDTEHEFMILLNEKKVRAVFNFQDEKFALNDQDVTQDCKRMQGIFILIWKECRDVNTIHFLWIDCKDKTCKNVSMESFGYDDEEIMGLFGKMFCFMASGIPQIENQKQMNLPENIN